MNREDKNSQENKRSTMAIFSKKRQPRPSGYDRSGQLMVEYWPENPQKAELKPDEEPKGYSLPRYTGPTCPECGAPARNGRACRALYEDLLRLENKDPKGAGSVHNLSVLCYVLQHPQDYSNEALHWGIDSLRELLDGQGPKQESQPKSWGLQDMFFPTQWFEEKSKVQPASRPSLPDRWRMTIDKVYHSDPYGHSERVQLWARTILGDLGQ